MSRSRAINRFHRWTAKVRRRHLKAWLPENQDVQATVVSVTGGDRRQIAALRDGLRELTDPLPLEDELVAQSRA